MIDVTRFDAAYYKDNMTVLFHLAGNSNLMNESLMMYIGVYAYGENRFDLTFNPCDANINRYAGIMLMIRPWMLTRRQSLPAQQQHTDRSQWHYPRGGV